MKHQEPEEKENTERWLITYADFITLLMVFFVVMYAMSQIDVAKYDQLAGSLNLVLTGGSGMLDNQQGIIGPNNGAGTSNNGANAPSAGSWLTTPSPTPTAPVNSAEVQNMEDVANQLKTYFTEQNIENQVSVSLDDRGLVISVSDAILFDLGSADIKPAAEKELVQIGDALTNLDNYIRVEGHTDNLPINTPRFSSNWALSAARATNVLQLLIDQSDIPPEKLSAVGYGEYRPIADNSTPEGRAQNRRVDIVVMSSRYNGLEGQASGQPSGSLPASASSTAAP